MAGWGGGVLNGISGGGEGWNRLVPVTRWSTLAGSSRPVAVLRFRGFGARKQSLNVRARLLAEAGAGSAEAGRGLLRLAPTARAAVTMRQLVLKQSVRGLSKEL